MNYAKFTAAMMYRIAVKSYLEDKNIIPTSL